MIRKTILLCCSPLLLIAFFAMLSATRPSCDFRSMDKLKVQVASDIVYELIPVEGGSITIGATTEQGNEPQDDERPAHRIVLENFWIGKCEVTQGLWYDVMGTRPSYFQDYKSAFSSNWRDLPVEQVSWEDCQSFIRRLNEHRVEMNLGEYGSWKFRLPTEAEWEYAARGGSKSRGYKYSGSDELSEVAWYDNNSRSGGQEQTHPVGQLKPNELGIYDMSGNVWEWCQDSYAKDYYQGSPLNNPCNNTLQDEHVIRGGSWINFPKGCRVSERNHRPSRYTGYAHGLRLVLAP